MHSGSATDAKQSQNESNDIDYDDITFVGQEKDGLFDGDSETYSTGYSQANDHRKVTLGNDDEYADIADTDPAGHTSSVSKLNTKAAPQIKPLSEQELSGMYTKRRRIMENLVRQGTRIRNKQTRMLVNRQLAKNGKYQQKRNCKRCMRNL